MSGLKKLRTRIASVESTKKITKAMQMVASNKFKKSQNAFNGHKTLSHLAGEICSSVFCDFELFPCHNLRKFLKAGDKNLIIVITADRGLCAGYNANIIKKYNEVIASKDEDKTSLIVIGKKGKKQFESNPILSRKKVNQIGYYDNESSSYASVTNDIAETIMESIISQELINRIFVIYSDFSSSSHNEPIVRQIWPLNEEPLNQESLNSGASNLNGEKVGNVKVDKHHHKKSDEGMYDYEPYAIEDVDPLYATKTYLKVSLMHCLLSSYASEMFSRMVAMEAATTNAKKVIDDLKLQLNRTRQNMITKELVEIISGAEAV